MAVLVAVRFSILMVPLRYECLRSQNVYLAGVGLLATMEYCLPPQVAPNLLVISDGQGDHFYMNRLFRGVEDACDDHLFTREFLRRFLVAEKIRPLAVIEHVGSAMALDAGNRALGVI